MRDNFLGGVVEGFYGQPWKQSQRLDLFSKMPDWGLNTYFYAPKDDLKHRAIWREPYDSHELESLRELANACERHAIRFIYGLSPGLDIRFSDPTELDKLKQRFEQLIAFGVHDFALLFDDLPGEMQAGDLDAFDSVAAAQCSVANRVNTWLTEKVAASSLLFCPTPYCDRMVSWQLGGATYLATIGEQLAAEIKFLWTGPEIISESISVESIQNLIEQIRRPPVLWDNLHANDYDLRRLYCGPYCGRSPELLDSIGGILSNPNNEYPINFVPLRTLGEFLRSPEKYDSRRAFLTSITEWMSQYKTVGEPVREEDLRLLADCFYLPYDEGPDANALQALIQLLIDQPVAEWSESFEAFALYHQQICRVFDGLTRLKNRDLFYAWSRRVWELKEEIDLIADFLARKKRGEDGSIGIGSETHLPKTYRGGMVARLQRKLSMNDTGRFRATR